MEKEQPVGLFDSGIGGFTVLKELQRGLPSENAVYLGDSKRMPYGERENAEIIAFANSGIRFLEGKGVKAILLACNTVSSLIDQLESRVPLFSIVEAGCEATLAARNRGAVGLIATTATVKNGAYERLLARRSDRVHYITQGTRTLAKIINNHPYERALLRKNIREAIDPILEKQDVDALLLGCTHFPIVRESIEQMYPELTIINPAERQIASLRAYLAERDLLNDAGGTTEIYTTRNVADEKIITQIIDHIGLKYDVLAQTELDVD
ncbi:MAG: glutamate racemase [Eubacterium sp.]|nr:glutamate racemase [Eubacterium sp.]